MRVEFHGLAHDAGHFVVASVFHALHDMQYAALHGFQSVFDVGNGTLQNDVGGIVEKPVLIHARELKLDVGLVAVGQFIGRMALGIAGFLLRAVVKTGLFFFVAHGAVQ